MYVSNPTKATALLTRPTCLKICVAQDGKQLILKDLASPLSYLLCLTATNQPRRRRVPLQRRPGRAKLMANPMVMTSSSKTVVVPVLAAAGPAKQRHPPAAISLKPIARAVQKPFRLSVPSLNATAATIATAAGSFLLAASPSLAAEIEKAALFDFNLTLPAIVVEFLLLMVALDKIYFTPLGKFMDERDAAIRESLSNVKDTSAEVKQLEEQANAVARAAKAEIAAALNNMMKQATEELEQKLAEGRAKVEAELDAALLNLERQKEETIKALDAQIAALSNEIVKKILPVN